jgi:hypothetical protein
MYNYGIGGNEVKLDASEAIADIANNRTLFVQKLTVNDAVKPEAVYDLKNVEEVFAHFKPQCTVDFTTEEGTTKSEELRFGNLGDFGVKSVIDQSSFLTNLNVEVEQYQKIAKQFKSNKVLKSLVETPEGKQTVKDVLTALLHELNSADDPGLR